MALWFVIIATICIAAVVRFTLGGLSSRRKNLPPGPAGLPLIGNLIWLTKPLTELELILRRAMTQYGPLVTMKFMTRHFVFIGSHSLAHRALVQNGALFADRPAPPPTSTLMNRRMKMISSSPYGPTWRLLRRNLTQEILNAARVKSYSGSRRWVLSLLIGRLAVGAESTAAVQLIDHSQYAMFCLLVLMCFGDRLQENQIKEIEESQRALLVGFRRFNRLNFWPRLGRILFRDTWKELIRLRENRERVLIPLIRDRIQAMKSGRSKEEDGILAYVDTLVDLHLPEENRKLGEDEMVSLCSEFLNAGTDTTSAAMQWIMASLVKHPEYQDKVYQEITGVVGKAPHIKASEGSLKNVVEEGDLEKMPYLKAVVLEGLRRHPPGHFVVPHMVKEDVELDGYTIPKSSIVNFMVADMGWDPKVWAEPMEFKPERFFAGNGEAFDITGSREIKMMPFGVGRRICPGLALALLHLEYFVANLIWYFEWSSVEGEEIDLSEKGELATVMKNPLRARISPRT